MDKKRTIWPGVMASKDPAAELRKLAGARLEAQLKSVDSQQDGEFSQASTQDNSPVTTPGSNNIQSLFDDGKSKSFAFLSSRKQRNRKSLFPLLADNPTTKPHTAPSTAAASPRPSTSTAYPDVPPTQGTWPRASHSSAEHPKSSTSTTFTHRPDLERTSSVTSDQSTGSSPALRLPVSKRGRSSTAGSGSGRSEETPPTPFAGESGRNSTSTAGRSSFSNLFHIGQRFRGHDPQSPKGSTSNILTPHSGFASGSNSMSMSRETFALPEREEGETAIQYLKRIEELTPRSLIPSILSKRVDEFHFAVMRSFMRTYVFFGDPLDMAIRKLLIEIVLPKETQQIDRVLQSFADRYQECNPGIFNSPG
jgi:Sec7-like guanine-nucleotide exchange factor